jgi:hypothetical protein
LVDFAVLTVYWMLKVASCS